MAATAAAANSAGHKKSTVDAVNQFNALREEQRQLAMKINQLEMESREHGLVIDVLNKVNPQRKCYRMIGGVLVERTAGDVLPQLTTNREQMNGVVEQMKAQLEAKGAEIVKFKEKHNIRIAGERQESDKDGQAAAAKAKDSSSGGVLVA